MEIREITTYNERAPFSGYGIWIVFELKHRKAHLIHPVTFTELVMVEYDYVKSAGDCLWPFNTTKSSFSIERFRKNLLDRIDFFIKNKRSFPLNLLATVISEIDECSIEDATKIITSMASVSTDHDVPISNLMDKASREFSLCKDADISGIRGRPLAIVQALQETKSASIYQITHLVNGRLKTKSDLSRVVTYFVHKLTSQGILEIVS